MTDTPSVWIHGFRVDDAGRVGIEGSIPLPGVTVLVGRDGVGKSLIIEYLDSVLSPTSELRGRQTADEPDDYYGWLYLDPHAGGQEDAVAQWLGHLADHGFSVDHLDVRELSGVLARSGWEGLAAALASDLPPDSSGPEAFVRAVTSSCLLGYQCLRYGSVQLALAPSAVEALRPMADRVLAGTNAEGPPPERTLAYGIATAISESTGGYVHLTDLVAFEGKRRWGNGLAADRPTVVWIRDDPQDPERAVDEAGLQGRWQVNEQMGVLLLDSIAWDRLRAVEERVNEIVPRFVRECGRVALSAVRSTEHGIEPGIAVRFALAAEGTTVDHRHVGAGMRRWIGASLLVACAEIDGRWVESLAVPREELTIGPSLVLLVDEPELHLHPAAQRDVADWLVQRNREGALVLVASHSPAFLDLPSELASLVAVMRDEGRTTLYDMTGDTLEAVNDLAEALGFDRHSWLYAVRGVLVVEGQHDMRVVRHFFGRELGEARVLPLPLRGSGNVMAMIESEFLGRAHVPLRVMFDNTSVDAFHADEMPERPRTPEERKLVQFLHQRRAGIDVEPIPYPEPDILCALPEEAVRRAYPDAKFGGWQAIIDDWTAREDRPGFKAYALKHLRIDNSPDDFLDRVLLHTKPGDHPSGALRQAIDTALASLTPDPPISSRHDG